MQYLAEPHQIGRQIIQTILRVQDSQTMLSEIALQLGEMFSVDVCAIVSGEANSVELLSKGLWRKKKYPELDLKEIDRTFWDLIRRDRQELESLELEIGNLQSYPLNSVGIRLGKVLSLKAVLAIALPGNVKGTILIGKERVYDWTNSEKELLHIVAESVAIAISQMQLQQQAQTKARYQTLIKEVSQAISQSADVESILDLAVTKTAKALQVNRGAIVMLKYKQPPLKDRHRERISKATAQIIAHWSARNHKPDRNQTYSFELLESSLTQEAWKKAPQPLAIAENAHFPDTNRDHLAHIFNAKTSQALLMMPLMGNASNDNKLPLVLGFLVLQHDSARPWGTNEIELVNWISIQISTAMIHSQTLSRVQSIVDERTARLKWSLEVQAKLSEKMRQQIEQLRQLNELKDDFLNSMSHELKTPLTSMKMAIKMLRQPELPEASKEKYLNILEQEWNREYNLIKDLLTLQQVESENFQVHPQELDLDEIVQQLARSFEQKWQADKGLTLTLESSGSPLTLYTDSESLQQILDELLLNAGKYSNPDTSVSLKVTRQVTPKNHQIEITVSNYGAGISPQELPYIFDKFRRGKGVTDRAVPGTGLGLTLVKYLVEHLNGTIEISSTPVEDNSSTFVTSFTVILPQFRQSK
jgi:signal transduction histidine kinase